MVMTAPGENRAGRLGEPFTLRVGESVAVEDAGVTVSFEKVARDSRCPKDVTCIRAGEAVVHLAVASGEAKAILELEVPPGGESPAARFQDLLVTIQELQPQKESRKPIDRSAYVAKVRVSRR
jgi:hypothetical protein